MTFPRKSFDLAHWKFHWKFKYITASMVSPYMICKSFAVVRIENQWKKSTHYTLISRLINRLVLDYGKLDLERLILRSFYDLFFWKVERGKFLRSLCWTYNIHLFAALIDIVLYSYTYFIATPINNNNNLEVLMCAKKKKNKNK